MQLREVKCTKSIKKKFFFNKKIEKKARSPGQFWALGRDQKHKIYFGWPYKSIEDMHGRKCSNKHVIF